MIIKSASNVPGKLHVTFQFPAAIWAESVYLVGDFNGWNSRSHPFTRLRDDGCWQVMIELETGRAYQFRYLVNGTQWQNDNHADGSAPNPLGGDNSVILT